MSIKSDRNIEHGKYIYWWLSYFVDSQAIEIHDYDSDSDHDMEETQKNIVSKYKYIANIKVFIQEQNFKI